MLGGSGVTSERRARPALRPPAPPPALSPPPGPRLNGKVAVGFLWSCEASSPQQFWVRGEIEFAHGPRHAASLGVTVLRRGGPTSLGACRSPQGAEAGEPECEPWTAEQSVLVPGPSPSARVSA